MAIIELFSTYICRCIYTPMHTLTPVPLYEGARGRRTPTLTPKHTPNLGSTGFDRMCGIVCQHASS